MMSIQTRKRRTIRKPVRRVYALDAIVGIGKKVGTEEAAMRMILHGGNARALAYEALGKAKKKQFKAAQEKLREADRELEEAHEAQTALLRKESKGVKQNASLLLAHAMDHLMNAAAEKGLISEILELYKLL